MDAALTRFLKYVSFHTTSDESCAKTPSTPNQLVFAEELREELVEIGLADVSLDENGYLMATLPANTNRPIPTIGFIAHLDTSPDMSGKDVSPQVVNYMGGDILLNYEQKIILSPDEFPELLNYVGQDIVVTDGKTLLGADDKAGIAAIVTASEYLINHPEIEHGKVRIAFTPDEEIGRGAHKFDVEKFGCEWAYTVDGGEIGELEFENFNAASAVFTIKGRNIHPGYAKGKMVNALHVANELIALFPVAERPEYTQGYEGFFHLVGCEGNVDAATVSFLIRDHDREKFQSRKAFANQCAQFMNEKYPGSITVETPDRYYNMREKVEPVMHIVDTAFEAMTAVGVTPKVKPIRGGTDGSQLSYKGLPCPNLFAGGHNFHGRYEYLPVPSLNKSVEVIAKIIELTSKK